MEHFRTNGLLPKRLDPWYYRPVFQKNSKAVEAAGVSCSLWDVIDRQRDVKGGATPLGAEYREGGPVRFYRTSNVKDMMIDESDVVTLTAAQDANLSRSRLESGDVLLTITGVYFGQLAVVAPIHLPGNISQHSVRFQPSKCDPHYLVAFFSSQPGQNIIWREAYGATRPAIDYPSVRDLSVLTPAPSAQTYIGDKVRQAERLRARARELEGEVTAYHAALIPDQSKLNYSRRSQRTATSILTDRMDAHFYPAVVEEYLDSITMDAHDLGSISKTVTNGQTQPASENGSRCLQVTVTNLSSAFLKGEARRVVSPGKRDRFTRPHDLLFCNAAHSKSYIGKEVTYCHQGDDFLPSTEVMLVRMDLEKVPASYVRTYLLTKIGYLQIQSTIRGITAHTYPEDVKKLRIPVPELKGKEQEEWFGQDDKMNLAGASVASSTLLTTAAKLLVEALIEGQVSEADLVAAQKALEANDRSADRAILQRLTRKGMDAANESALFPDLDALYDALDALDGREEVEA